MSYHQILERRSNLVWGMGAVLASYLVTAGLLRGPSKLFRTTILESCGCLVIGSVAGVVFSAFIVGSVNDRIKDKKKLLDPEVEKYATKMRSHAQRVEVIGSAAEGLAKTLSELVNPQVDSKTGNLQTTENLEVVDEAGSAELEKKGARLIELVAKANRAQVIFQEGDAVRARPSHSAMRITPDVKFIAAGCLIGLGLSVMAMTIERVVGPCQHASLDWLVSSTLAVSLALTALTRSIQKAHVDKLEQDAACLIWTKEADSELEKLFPSQEELLVYGAEFVQTIVSKSDSSS
jgi:hypothetical protein